MEFTRALSRLNDKKGIIAIITVIVTILVGAFAAQCYYTWNVGYRINPLTYCEEIEVPKTTGATWGRHMWGTPPDYADTIHVSKRVEVFFKVTEEDTEAIELDFCDLWFSIFIYGPGPDGELGTEDDELMYKVWLPLVINCEGQGQVEESVMLEPGDYGVIKNVEYFTRPVETEVSGHFTICIWAEEVIVPAVVPATIDIDPDTLNLKSEGLPITCYIELPEGYGVGDIVVSTVKLYVGEEYIATAEPWPTAINDYDGDGIPDLMVKFARATVVTRLIELGYGHNDFMVFRVRGELLDGTLFEGTDTIRVIKPPA